MTKTKLDNTSQITIIGMLFFIFGFVTWLNNTLIPYQIAYRLETSQAVLVTFPFTSLIRLWRFFLQWFF